MKKYIFCILINFGCHKEIQLNDSMSNVQYPVETITCSHPETRNKASISASVKDSNQWKSVGLEIKQKDLMWMGELQNTGENLWETDIILIGVKCSDDFYHDFFYAE